MPTHCNSPRFLFQKLSRRRVEAAFDAGRVTSDGGVLLLRETAQLSDFFGRVADCFQDHRSPSYVEHSVEDLVAQRILGLACGYEDLNDHDALRADAALALAVGKSDPHGLDRRHKRDQGKALAGHATLNRIELAPVELNPARRDLKVLHDPDAIERLFVDMFLDAHDEPPEQITLDLDATDDPLHGKQEGRFFHGYYRSYCYLPLYIFCGDFLLAAKLRRANQDGAAGSLEELKRIVGQVRERWPDVKVLIRGDSGFCRDWLMTWCEQTPGVDFVLGLARNKRLNEMIEGEMDEMVEHVAVTGEPRRVYKELRYRTLDSWSGERRVVGKAEALVGKRNPRFVVTSLSKEEWSAAALYADLYCARGDMENRIKEQQLGMFADRTSSHTMRANQLRLWFSSLAYVLVHEFRRIALRATKLARAQVWTIRTRLLKIGALVRQSVRRVYLSMSSAFALQDVYAEAHARLVAAREGRTV